MKFVSPWIHTTNLCNEKCKYCFVKQNGEIMQKPIYDALEKLLIGLETEKIHLRFAGGEPLLVFNFWKDFAIRMSKNPKVTIEVLTNFYLVPDDFWEFCKLENVNISISLDNGTRAKKLNRNIIDRISKLSNPWIMTTLTKDNIQNIEELAAFIGSNNYGWSITTDYFGKSTIGWDAVSEKIISIFEILKKLNYDFTKISFNNCSMNPNFSGCRAGKEMFAVNCNGDIYQCQTVISVNKKLGDVFSGYSPIEKKKKVECNSCIIGDICNGWCPLHYKITKNSCVPMEIFSYLNLKENI
jgi:uncharacterized protein